MAEYSSTGTLVHAYIWGPTGITTRITSPTVSAPVVIGYTFDPSGNRVGRHLYDSVALGSRTGIITLSADIFDAYGQPLEQYDPAFQSGDYSGKYDPIAYKGQFGCYTDIESGLIYCHNRFYSPAFGRWISRDPIGLEGGLNVYEFCGNNPVMGADPSGLQQQADPEVPWYKSIIPVYGSALEAEHSFKTGHPVWGVINVALAISDIFLVKSIVVAPVKLGAKLLTKEGMEMASKEGVGVAIKKAATEAGVVKATGSKTRSAVSSWLRTTGRATKGEIAHHGAIRVNSKIGKLLPDWLKNQPWNYRILSDGMKPGVPVRAMHDAIHGQGKVQLSLIERLWYGAPLWTRPAATSIGGHAGSLFGP